MTKDQFKEAAGIGAGLATRWFSHLDATFFEFEIASPVEQAMFIAQAGHESNGFTATAESFNYSVAGLQSTFGKRLTPEQGKMLGRQRGETEVPVNRQAAIANLVYGSRLGNKSTGDGWKYRGRGLIQVTGLENYRTCGAGIKTDLLLVPELLEKDENAMRSAGWFWQSRNCSKYPGDIERVTRLINGGKNGLADRQERFERARQALT
ncbi:glycoside hydrolase family 19 protein [Erwinia pyrifoliae]|uniref:glycoside hydrolase family 19 protein n=1 Tax=Erwinia pyrifoliae TaxID=79967 RepID=UPI00223B5815|nr:glycoside hydrolase family 19 protein [Erwinia pyrifoliae]MCT2387133.1 glycoside hydrolase family 19 protein [Erwinia pyrifoliae]MCU8587267.1 glycoside hydrolase family 19 protein [Erwinia pyrifoliae]